MNNNMRRRNDNNYNPNEDYYEMKIDEEYSNYSSMNNQNQYRAGYNENFNRVADNNLNNNTLINFDGGKPVGLDLNKFMNDMNPDMTVHAISQSNDLPIISEVNEQHQSFKGIVSKRLNCLKMIANCWAGSNYSSAFNAINL
jgi:hypothetical protein